MTPEDLWLLKLWDLNSIVLGALLRSNYNYKLCHYQSPTRFISCYEGGWGRRTCLCFPPAALRLATALKLQLSFSHSSKHYPVPRPPSLPSSDGSITGAMLRELLKLSLSVCVSSNVQAEPSNLLTTQEKKKANEEEKQSLRSPNDARWEPSSARFCWAALPTPAPVLFLAAPGLRFSDAAILGLSAWWGPSSCLQQKKKSQQPNREINKEIKEHFPPSAEKRSTESNMRPH